MGDNNVDLLIIYQLLGAVSELCQTDIFHIDHTFIIEIRYASNKRLLTQYEQTYSIDINKLHN